jgi:hypothetical protein
MLFVCHWWQQRIAYLTAFYPSFISYNLKVQLPLLSFNIQKLLFSLSIFHYFHLLKLIMHYLSLSFLQIFKLLSILTMPYEFLSSGDFSINVDLTDCNPVYSSSHFLALLMQLNIDHFLHIVFTCPQYCHYHF